MSDGCVDKLKVLAEETRLAVLELLMERPMRVGELGERLGVEQSLLSHHLRVLRDADLVAARRDGKGVTYELAEGVVGSRTDNALHLGCCKLTFDSGEGDA